MLKIRGNIIFITGLILVIFIWIGSPASSSGESVMICEATEMQTSDGSSGCLSIHDDIYEDEQVNPVFGVISVAESVTYFSDNQNQSIIFQPSFIPWEPPRI